MFAIHGVDGAVVASTGVFATTAVNAAGVDRLLSGNAGQLANQAIEVAVVGAYSAIATGGIPFVVNLVTPTG